eukprot:TRINITY_DN1319_c0_g1_i4.p1 TRINITY_DN1319_c0_g1~~TRINITY_DN1319_c0_g1_i4.p1  ORF type:complete len:567 (-),score=155.98 TRINITY_DN1319_c0_g1_i4:118-1818(-)
MRVLPHAIPFASPSCAVNLLCAINLLCAVNLLSSSAADELHITPLVENPHQLLEEAMERERQKEIRDKALAGGMRIGTEGSDPEQLANEAKFTPKIGVRSPGGIVQMRPSLQHVDAEARAVDETKRLEMEAEMLKKQQRKTTKATDGSLSVAFERRETSISKKIRQQSFAGLKQRQDEEKWCKCTYHTATSVESAAIFDKLFCQSDSEIDVNAERDHYRTLLYPVAVTDEPGIPAAASDPLSDHLWSMCTRDTRTVPHQLKTLMQSVHAISFGELKKLIKGSVSDTQLIGELAKIAECVQGCWVVKSEQVYKCSEICRVRDHLLRMFAQTRTVVRREFVEKSKSTLPPEDVKQILTDIAVFVPSKHVWEFKCDSDLDFLSSHPGVKQFGAKKVRAAKKSDKSSGGGPSHTSAGVAKAPPPRALSEEDHLVHNFLKAMFKRFGVCNLSFLKQHLQRQVETRPPNAFGVLRIDTLDSLLRSNLADIAGELHGAFFLRNVEDERTNGFRRVILELFAADRKLSKSQVFAGVQQYEELGPLPASTYTTIMKELAYSKGVCWFFKTGNGGK